MRRLESGGVELDMLQLVTSSHLLLDPPAEDREEERVWCIEFFRGKMFDFGGTRPRETALWPNAATAPSLVVGSRLAPRRHAHKIPHRVPSLNAHDSRAPSLSPIFATHNRRTTASSSSG